MSDSSKHIDFGRLRDRLEDEEGREYWRSLEELAETEEFQHRMAREFPEQASEWLDSNSRRRFMKIMGASLAMAGLMGCMRQPAEKILPYVEKPEEIEPKKPLFYATSAPTIGGFAEGVVVENYMGRPIKVEGNPDHPANLGATSPHAQGSVLTLYDPDRSQTVRRRRRPSTWEQFLDALEPALARQQRLDGRGMRILTESVTSPTLGDQISRIVETFPEAQWHQYEPTADDNRQAGLAAATGEVARPVYRFDRADTVLSLGSDFLYGRPGSVRYANDFTEGREPAGEMNRLYVAETTPSVTGGMADHRLPLPASRIGGVLRGVAERMDVDVPDGVAAVPAAGEGWIDTATADLLDSHGTSIVLAGYDQPAAVHELVYAVNDALGNLGETVIHERPPAYRPVHHGRSLERLTSDMQEGNVDVLVVLSGNPVYYAPDDLAFSEALQNVEFSVHAGLHFNETGRQSDWHIPAKHYLEEWSDRRAFNGAVSIQQPLIDELYEACRSTHTIAAALLGNLAETDYSVVHSAWEDRFQGENFDAFWDLILHEGLIPDDAPLAFDPPAPELGDVLPSEPAGGGPSGVPGDEELEIVFEQDPSVLDGRYANNGWLQELPKPINKLTWDNAALVSPATAEALDLQSEDVVELEYEGRTVRAPVWVLPGQADGAVTVRLGYGRDTAGRVASGAGFNAYRLRTSDNPWFGRGLTVGTTGDTYPLACRQEHFLLHGRALARVGTHEEYRENPNFAQEMGENPPEDMTLYPDWEYDEGNQWGMSIDLGTCIGCGACTIACQAENNIPVVGKDGVLNGRIMHWIRVDRYFSGEMDNPDIVHQPVPCMHCENAPCEVVCPVNATVHDDEGLNEMIYNRCIGTRYCSNNCPYKVRRFNFFHYTDAMSETEEMRENPEVTVRSRGVMEKCTYCIQRIKSAKIEAKKENRPVRDGEIQTACQQACPSNAITFGDINDPSTLVVEEKEKPRNYAMLAELNTRPRTTYLARITNPNEELPELEWEYDGEPDREIEERRTAE